MKHTLLKSLFLIVLPITIYSQGGTWVWVKGDSTLGLGPTYGMQGVASATNQPSSVYESANWIDTSGNLWIFGGQNPTDNYMSDLWMYNPATNMWTWIKGPGVEGQAGVYGTQ